MQVICNNKNCKFNSSKFCVRNAGFTILNEYGQCKIWNDGKQYMPYAAAGLPPRYQDDYEPPVQPEEEITEQVDANEQPPAENKEDQVD